MFQKIACLFVCLATTTTVLAQSIPSKFENVDFLVTFGNQAELAWGDDDFVQTYFVVISPERKTPFYIRVFDPETGGQHDQVNESFNTTTNYAVYGGKGAFTTKDARQADPVGNYQSGVKLANKSFGKDAEYDNKWYTLGPFNPKSGEFVEDQGGYIFKIIAKGISGDDGNGYSYFVSSSPKENIAVESTNSFAYEISFRLKNDVKNVGHFYPFVDNNVTSVKQFNFDFDNDGFIRLTSLEKNRHSMKGSGNGKWSNSKHSIEKGELNTCLDLHVVKNSSASNDMVIYMENQYKEAIPFYSIPVNGFPRYKYNPVTTVEIVE